MATMNSDKLAAEAMRRAGGLLVVIDRHGEILMANDNWLRLAIDFDGDPAVCGPGADYFEVCRRAAAQGEPVATQVLDACADVLADGHARTVEYACAPPHELTGPPSLWYRLRITRLSKQRLLLEHIDVSDHQAIVQQATALASEASFERLVLKAISEPVIATDPHGIVTFWNGAAESLFGYRADEALGQPVTNVTVPETSREQAAEILAALSSGSSWTGEFWLRHRDGTRFPARVTDIPIIDGDGRMVGIVGVSVDLRPHYAREAEQQRVRELEGHLLQSQKLEALGTVTGGVAHEFNNVLAAVLGHAEALREAVAGDEYARASADSILEASQRGRDIVYSLLAFSRPQSGERTAVNAEQWFRSALRMLEPIIPTEVTLTTAFEAPPTTLLANDTHLTQILLNLASNSAYAMRESARRELHIRVTREPSTTLRYGAPCDMLRLEVRDSGTGMDAAALARVFDPFFTTKPIGDGTGLGLAVVHGLVSAHDGTIAFDSAPGVGTAVLVRLPVYEDASTLCAPMRCEPTTIGPERVLLVDDDAMVLRALTRTLERAGLTVSGFTDPHEALRTVRSHEGPLPWTVAVFDYAMPGMRGDELATALAQSGVSIPVLLCTGNASEIRSNPSLVREVLEKPVTSDTLVQALLRVLRGAP